MRVGVRLGLASLLLAAGAASAQVVLTVRVLPQPLCTNLEPFRIGLQVGFPGGAPNPLRAERLAEGALAAEPQVSVQALRGPDASGRSYWVTNAGARAGGVVLATAPLRKGVPYTVRVRCRAPAKVTLRFGFSPSGGDARERTEKATSVKAGPPVEKAFAVTPHKDGVFQCAFQVAPGAAIEVAGFSMLPEDSVDGWDSQAMEALRRVSPGVLRWPEEGGAGSYGWYDGVGPRAARERAGHAFGTAEFVGLCRLVGAQPLVRVTVPQPGAEAAGAAGALESGAQLAADWVAYCNAPSNQALGALRARHGYAVPLGVGMWELAAPAGAKADPAGFGAACRAYAAAMRAADAAVRVGAGLAPGDAAQVAGLLQEAGAELDFVSCGAPGAREAVAAHNRARGGRQVAWSDTRREGVADRYVAEVLGRLEAGAGRERDYYAGWYGALSLVNAALAGARAGCGPVCARATPELLLNLTPQAKHMLTETGLLLALVNRFPAKVPLATSGAPAEPHSPFQVTAAWTEDATALVAYVYNSGTESRTVRLDLAPLERRFAFWASEQIAADIRARPLARVVPVTRQLKAGSALTQVLLCESLPSSFTRIIVKE